MSQVSYGTITITDTNDIESIVIEYNKNQSNQNPPSEGDSNWSTSRPAWQQGYYIWQRTRIHKSGTATTADIIGTPVCVTGSTGEQGQPGTAGRSLTGVETKYCIYGTGTPSDSYSGWQDTIPEYNSSTPNYWVKVTNTYSSAPTTEIVKYKDTGITNAMAKAADAQSRAATAETNASNALSLSQATQQHFWFNSVKTGNIEAGAYITDVVVDSFKPNKSGNYLLAGSNGIELGNGSHPYMQLTTSELNFFHPNSSTIDAQLSSNGLIVKSGGIEAGTVGQDGGIYLSTKNYGTTHNNQAITINGHEAKNWRQIIGTKFGVDSDGVLYAGGANIRGKITVTSGSNVYTTDNVNPLEIGGTNLIVVSQASIGQTIDNTGAIIDKERTILSDFIPIEGGENYILQYWLPEDLTDTGSDQAWCHKIAWYGTQIVEGEETETYLEGYESVSLTNTYYKYSLKAPTNATACRVSFTFPASADIDINTWMNGSQGFYWQLEQGTVETNWTLAPADENNLISQQDYYLLTNTNTNIGSAQYIITHTDNPTKIENVDELSITQFTTSVDFIQQGSGIPSSTNIRTINGRSSVNITISEEDSSSQSTVYTINFEEPVYGGILNILNKTIEITKGYIQSYNGESLPGFWVSDRDEYVENSQPSLGAQVVYDLQNSNISRITIDDISLIPGTNVIQSDSGEMYISTQQNAEWTTIPQIPDENNPYVWWKYILTYSSGQNYESTPVIFNSTPQGQIDELTQQINNHNSEINDINNVTVNLGNQYNSLSTEQEKITNQLANYEKNITIDSKMPMIKVYSRTATEESSVTVYSNNVIIKGGGNTTTEINSEGLKTNIIETQTLMPKNNNIGHLAFIARQNGHLSLKVVT